MKIDYISIGKRVKQFRASIGRSQEQLSEQAGLTPAHLSHIETGNTKVSLPSLVNLAEALGVTVDDLLVDSIVKTKHVSMKEMNDLLSDCSNAECRALLQIMEASKSALRTVR